VFGSGLPGNKIPVDMFCIAKKQHFFSGEQAQKSYVEQSIPFVPRTFSIAWLRSII
jgi:hypothetical protein